MALTPEQWKAIRTAWEYDPDEPGYLEAAERAGAKHGFKPPTRQAVHLRAQKENWERRGSMAGIVAAAQRKADALVRADGSPEPPPSPEAASATSARHAAEARDAAEGKRAEVLARHRREWQQVAALRQEALAARQENLAGAFERAKLAKITAEITALQQQGERKAWGLDELPVDPKELRGKTDAELLAIVSGHGKLTK